MNLTPQALLPILQRSVAAAVPSNGNILLQPPDRAAATAAKPSGFAKYALLLATLNGLLGICRVRLLHARRVHGAEKDIKVPFAAAGRDGSSQPNASSRLT
jgi:hypothetical protein